MLRISPWVLLVLTGCTDRLALETTSSSSGPTSADETGPGSTGPTSEPTTNSPTTGEPATSDTSTTSTDPTTGANTTSDTSNVSDPSDPSSTGEPATPSNCGPPCADTFIYHGDLTIGPGQSTDAFACMVAVTNTLTIGGDRDAAEMAALRNLQRVGRLHLEFNPTLTDLSPFECLELASEGLRFAEMPALTDVSALAGVREAGYVVFEGTGIESLPTFHPDFTGVYSVALRDNPALGDLSAMAGWGHLGEALTINLDNNPALTSLVGIEGPIAAAGDIGVAVQVSHSPQLESLAGLEAMTSGALWLQDLPKVTDLLPLSGMTHATNITLFGMPGLKDLQGLHNLGSLDWLMLGDCVSNQAGAPGLDGLTDLKGLGALTAVNSLSIANNAGLAALTGAPKLKFVGGMEVIENPKLAQSDVDALVAQLDAVPDQCIGGFDQCVCFEILPW